jgi:hypothetical protein
MISDWTGDAVYMSKMLFTSFREQDYIYN